MQNHGQSTNRNIFNAALSFLFFYITIFRYQGQKLFAGLQNVQHETILPPKKQTF